MGKDSIQDGKTQADFIQEKLNFNIDSTDPVTKASLSDHLENEWIDILGNGQLKKKVILKGKNGTRPNRGDICTLKIIGKLKNNQKIVENYEDFVIQLGDVEVVQGLDLAIAMMDVNEIAVIEVDPRFAYGILGQRPDIPPDATIEYTVELKTVDLETDIDTLSIKQRKEIGNKKRERGNWWFIRDEPSLAIQCYRKALDYLSPTMNVTNSSQHEKEETVGDAELQDLLEDRMKVYNNLAASQMKTQAYDLALESVDNVLNCQPQNVKALFRKGKILHYKGEHEQAYLVLLQAAKLEPESKIIQTELAILKEKNAKDALHEKHLYRKMLGTNKNTNNSKNMNMEKKQKTNKAIWGLIGGASAAALVGLLAYRFAT
ncbi:FK506-binding protein 8 [Harpegnathos saltator]|uniref:peptidylprolyl isomerase n=2 Tax=Harpegnathos saltator TaxID=610380 RepID=E2C4I6_HARSA|nr:FK506-binding protein 8 [Harpegnathos saltator]